MYATGSLATRRETSAPAASSNSASSTGVSQPASASRRATSLADGERAGLGELPPLLISLQSGRELVELPGEHARDVAARDLHAVVRHAVLREVVGADLLRACPSADLSGALRRHLRLLRRQLDLIEPRAQHPHRLLPVLELRLLVLHRHDEAGRLVR